MLGCVMSMNDDPRFTMGFYIDVVAVLVKHGFVIAPGIHSHSDSLVELLHLVHAFEGKPRGNP